MQIAATLLLLLSTPFFVRYWRAQHPTSLDWLADKAGWLIEQVPVTVALWTGIVLLGLGVIFGVL